MFFVTALTRWLKINKKKVFTLIVNFFKANEPVIVHER